MNINELRCLIKKGHFVAITLDTNIFQSEGYRFEEGYLKRLEQFCENQIATLIISEVVNREIKSHISQSVKEAQDKFMQGLKGIKKYWKINEEEIEQIKKLAFNDTSYQDLVSIDLNKFQQSTSLEIIGFENVSIEILMDKYFNCEPPFGLAKKKTEFPDAIALLSLDEWADRNETKIIAVSNDGDWESFCENSTNLVLIKDLPSLFKLFQAEEAEEFCEYLSEHYLDIIDGNLDEMILNKLQQEICDIIEVDYDGDVQNLDINVDNSFEFKKMSEKNIIFTSINYKPDANEITVSATIEVKITAQCDLFDSVYDSLDGDYTIIGGVMDAKFQTLIDQEVFIYLYSDTHMSFRTPLEIVEIEIIKKTINIDGCEFEGDSLSDEEYGFEFESDSSSDEE